MCESTSDSNESDVDLTWFGGRLGRSSSRPLPVSIQHGAVIFHSGSNHVSAGSVGRVVSLPRIHPA